ncbi:LPS-assembly protein LptD [Alcanivorax sp. ALC70]|nr:LPS-assembly protein LptD [Alcanivorax sp. ALC70]
MPLPKPSFLAGLALSLAGVAGADDDLNWVDRETMDALPPVQQRPIPVWCSGIYYNPRVGVPAERSDTIITADRTSLTQDGLIEMGGDVLIEEPGRRLTTQSALLDQSSGKFQVDNALRLETDQFTFLADGMSGQTDRREASLDRVRYALFGPAPGVPPTTSTWWISSSPWNRAPTPPARRTPTAGSSRAGRSAWTVARAGARPGT